MIQFTFQENIKDIQVINQNFFLFDDVIFLLVFSSVQEIDFSFITRVDTITHRFKTKFDTLFAEGEKFAFPL